MDIVPARTYRSRRDVRRPTAPKNVSFATTPLDQAAEVTPGAGTKLAPISIGQFRVLN